MLCETREKGAKYADGGKIKLMRRKMWRAIKKTYALRSVRIL